MGKKTRHLLFSAASGLCEKERASLLVFGRRKPFTPALGQRHQATSEPPPSSPLALHHPPPDLLPGQILGMPNRSGLQPNNQNLRLGVMAWG